MIWDSWTGIDLAVSNHSSTFLKDKMVVKADSLWPAQPWPQRESFSQLPHPLRPLPCNFKVDQWEGDTSVVHNSTQMKSFFHYLFVFLYRKLNIDWTAILRDWDRRWIIGKFVEGDEEMLLDFLYLIWSNSKFIHSKNAKTIAGSLYLPNLYFCKINFYHTLIKLYNRSLSWSKW